MTIVEFLLARITEDEAAVERSRRHNAEGVYANDNYGCLLVDPMRVLAECQAKRAIVAEWSDDAQYPDFSGGYESAIDNVLGHLAVVYADHPDYDTTWRVT